jgi:septal ring factor EnvC (AmiA/AmiB activator)
MRTTAAWLALLTVLSLIAPSPLRAQDEAARAAQIADKQEAEERQRRLAADVERLQLEQQQIQKSLSRLAEEMRALREDLIKANNAAVTRDELRALARKVEEIDQKREADKRLILEELQKLLKVAAQTPPPTPAPAPSPAASPRASAPVPDKGYEHVVEKNENLSMIIQAYRERGVKVTLKQVLDANPKINPNTKAVMRGQKIFIPDASK